MLPRLSRAVILHPLRSDWDVSLHLVQVHQPSRRSARRCFMNKIGAERYNNEYKNILRGTMGSLHAQNSNLSLLMGWCWLEWLLSERSIVQLSKFTILVSESIMNIPWLLISTLFDVWNSCCSCEERYGGGCRQRTRWHWSSDVGGFHPSRIVYMRALLQ